MNIEYSMGVVLNIEIPWILYGHPFLPACRNTGKRLGLTHAYFSSWGMSGLIEQQDFFTLGLGAETKWWGNWDLSCPNKSGYFNSGLGHVR